MTWDGPLGCDRSLASQEGEHRRGLTQAMRLRAQLPGDQWIKEDFMNRCEICGNEYDKTMEIVVNGISHYFDCFECAIHAIAPRCGHCGCKIIGHGIEANGTFYCCAHCAHMSGATTAVDNVAHAST